MLTYTSDILDLFNTPAYVYSTGSYDIIKGAGDQDMGEYVNLYLQVEWNKTSLLDSRILGVRFSAVGGVMLIATAEKFCRMIDKVSFREAILKCDDLRNFGLIERRYATNFVIEAFHKCLEVLHNSGSA